MKAADSAARIWDTLEQHPGGLPNKMLRHYGDLSPSQLRRGLDYINELFEDDADAPIITLWRGEWIYSFALTEIDTREYWARHLRGQITRARREHNRWHKTYLKFPTVENERQEELARRRVIDLKYAQDRMFGQERLSA
jgi:hypothetical protein